MVWGHSPGELFITRQNASIPGRENCGGSGRSIQYTTLIPQSTSGSSVARSTYPVWLPSGVGTPFALMCQLLGTGVSGGLFAQAYADSGIL